MCQSANRLMSWPRAFAWRLRTTAGFHCPQAWLMAVLLLYGTVTYLSSTRINRVVNAEVQKGIDNIERSPCHHLESRRDRSLLSTPSPYFILSRDSCMLVQKASLCQALFRLDNLTTQKHRAHFSLSTRLMPIRVQKQQRMLLAGETHGFGHAVTSPVVPS
jgi:hypothetical protein